MSLSSLEKTTLRFLREETYSSVGIIQSLLEHNNVQATHQLLKRMKAKGYLASAKIQAGIYTVPLLFGITEFGQAYAWDLDEEVGNTKTFQPSKVSAFILQHELDMQLMHIKALKLGWTWNNAKHVGKRVANVKYPDAIATCPGNTRYSVEIERNIKGSASYRRSLAGQLFMRKQGHWDKILYLCPTQDFAERLLRKIKTLDHLTWEGQRIKFTEAHLEHFIFTNYNYLNNN
jgi:hypothetical protein